MAKALTFSDAVKSPQEAAGFLRRTSGSSQGTGSEQTIAHGLGVTPDQVLIRALDNPASAVPSVRTADNSNFYVTVDNEEHFQWIAEAW